MIVKGHHFVVSKLACRFLDRLPSCYSSVFPRTDRASWCFPAHRCFEALRTVYSVTGTPLGFKGCRANVSQQIDDFFSDRIVLDYSLVIFSKCKSVFWIFSGRLPSLVSPSWSAWFEVAIGRSIAAWKELQRFVCAAIWALQQSVAPIVSKHANWVESE